jgi:hypothetical protein
MQRESSLLKLFCSVDSDQMIFDFSEAPAHSLGAFAKVTPLQI